MLTEAEKEVERRRARRVAELKAETAHRSMDEATPPWTVRQLVEALSQLPDQDRVVQTEGCDCWGNVKGIADIAGCYLLSREVV